MKPPKRKIENPVEVAERDGCNHLTVGHLRKLLSKFDDKQEVLFMPANEEGDINFPLISIDPWEVGKYGACVISVNTYGEE